MASSSRPARYSPTRVSISARDGPLALPLLPAARRAWRLDGCPPVIVSSSTGIADRAPASRFLPLPRGMRRPDRTRLRRLLPVRLDTPRRDPSRARASRVGVHRAKTGLLRLPHTATPTGRRYRLLPLPFDTPQHDFGLRHCIPRRSRPGKNRRTNTSIPLASPTRPATYVGRFLLRAIPHPPSEAMPRHRCNGDCENPEQQPADRPPSRRLPGPQHT